MLLDFIGLMEQKLQRKRRARVSTGIPSNATLEKKKKNYEEGAKERGLKRNQLLILRARLERTTQRIDRTINEPITYLVNLDNVGIP